MQCPIPYRGPFSRIKEAEAKAKSPQYVSKLLPLRHSILQHGKEITRQIQPGTAIARPSQMHIFARIVISVFCRVVVIGSFWRD